MPPADAGASRFAKWKFADGRQVTILLTAAAVLIALTVAGLAASVGHRQWRIARERRALARTVTTLSAWVAGRVAGSPDGAVPVAEYPQLAALLDRELPEARQESRLLGPALIGMELRLHLAGRAFRDAWRATQPDVPFCREVVEQLQFALVDLERTLGLSKPVARPAE